MKTGQHEADAEGTVTNLSELSDPLRLMRRQCRLELEDAMARQIRDRRKLEAQRAIGPGSELLASCTHKPVDTLGSPGLFHSSTLQKKVLTGGHQGT